MFKARGYASIFGNVDSYGEAVDRGAFSQWLADNPDTQLPLFWQHSYIYDPLAGPVGVTTTIRQDKRGLYYEAEILDTAAGLELQQQIRAKAVTAASFGFSVQDQYEKKDVWHLSAVSPVEITACRWGANPLAYIEEIPGQGSSEESSDGDE